MTTSFSYILYQVDFLKTASSFILKMLIRLILKFHLEIIELIFDPKTVTDTKPKSHYCET